MSNVPCFFESFIEKYIVTVRTNWCFMHIVSKVLLVELELGHICAFFRFRIAAQFLCCGFIQLFSSRVLEWRNAPCYSNQGTLSLECLVWIYWCLMHIVFKVLWLNWNHVTFLLSLDTGFLAWFLRCGFLPVVDSSVPDTVWCYMYLVSRTIYWQGRCY